MKRSTLIVISRWLAFAALLVAAASIREGPSAVLDQAIVWLPTGVAIAGLCLLGLHAAWVIAAATLVQRFVLGYDWSVGVTAAAGSTLEAVLGLVVLRRLGFDRSLARLRDMLALFVAAMIAPLGSIPFSWFGRAYVWVDPGMPFYSGWDGWWRMNALGAITVVPIAVTWLGIPRQELTGRLLAHVAAALVGIPAVVLGLLAVLPSGAPGVMWLDLALVGVAVFAAERFSMRGVTLATALSALMVAVAASRGFGPFASLPRGQVHVVIQLFELTLVAIPPAFAALMAERRAAVARVRHHEELLASINRNVKDGRFRADPELRLLYANLALARMFGRATAGAMHARSLGEAMVDPVRRAELLGLVREQGQWLNEEIRFRREDGTTFWGLVSGTGVRDAAGAIVHYDGAVTDITAHKALEERFRQAQKMEAVGKLAGGVAHDFNNLLTVIIGYAETIRTEPDNPAAVRADAAEVLDAATRAAGLTRQLLAYSRRQVLSPEVLDLCAVVDRMGGMLRRIIGENVDLAVVHRSGPCWVRVDPSQIEQVLLNLVVNARDAMEGGGSLVISTAEDVIDEAAAAAQADRTAGPCVMLRVADTGAGMTSEVLARAFDPFFTTKPMGGGTGLGLATVYGIVRQSGGSVWLESSPGTGTTACVCLPRASSPTMAAASPTPVAGVARGGTVLVVEDEPALRALVSETLASRGFHVLCAADGARGLEAAQTHAGLIDLVVTDVVMPVMGGREMAGRLRAQRPGQRVLFMSGYPDDASAPFGLESGSGALLAKPFTPDQLLARVDALL